MEDSRTARRGWLVYARDERCVCDGSREVFGLDAVLFSKVFIARRSRCEKDICRSLSGLRGRRFGDARRVVGASAHIAGGDFSGNHHGVWKLWKTLLATHSVYIEMLRKRCQLLCESKDCHYAAPCLRPLEDCWKVEGKGV